MCGFHWRLGFGFVTLLFPLESSADCPGNSLVLSHGVRGDFYSVKSRQWRAGISLDALSNGNSCFITGSSIHSPKELIHSTVSPPGKSRNSPETMQRVPTARDFPVGTLRDVDFKTCNPDHRFYSGSAAWVSWF